MKNNKYLNYDLDNLYEHSKFRSLSISEDIYKINMLPKTSTHVLESKGFINYYNSYELIPLRKALRLRKIFIYILHSKKFKIDVNTFNKVKRNYKTIDLILNGIQQGSYKFININNILYLRFNSEYGYTKNHSFGRLYPKRASISQISKEFRSFLFKDIYKDIDIVNAHPTILYLYAKSVGLSLPSLKQLVYSREEFYAIVFDEYNGSILKENLKRTTLACLNMNETQFGSKLLTDLNKDILTVRESLYQRYYLKDVEFRTAVDLRMSMDNKLIHSNRLQKIQSLYCYNMETSNIMKFRSFLLDKYDGVEFSSVPFFDGLFIEEIDIHDFDEDVFHLKQKFPSLDTLVKEYNDISNIKFVSKEMDSKFKFLTNSQFMAFGNVIDFIDKLTYNETENLLNKYGISLSPSDILKNTLSSCSSELSFSYEDINKTKLFVNNKFADLIDCILEDKTLNVNP